MDRITYHGTPYATIHGMTDPIYSDYPIRAIMNKLAEYEDAEEHGLLLRLPCKVGTTIYMINHYWIDEGHICGIEESDDIDCFCYKVYCDPDDYTMVAAADFNKTWFLTEREAEQALQKGWKENG